MTLIRNEYLYIYQSEGIMLFNNRIVQKIKMRNNKNKNTYNMNKLCTKKMCFS